MLDHTSFAFSFTAFNYSFFFLLLSFFLLVVTTTSSAFAFISVILEVIVPMVVKFLITWSKVMSQRTLIFIFFYCCTVHSGICSVYSPTNALFLFLKHIKIYIKIRINIAPTCFGLRSSSGSLH